MKNLKTNYAKLLAMLFLVISIAFVPACSDDDDDPDPVDKTALSAKITEAENLIATTEEGTANGQYTFGSQDVLQDVIDLAKVVELNSLATQIEVDNSVVALEAAITVYEAAEIVPIAPDALIGHWAFDDGTGTTAKDYSDNGFDGTFGTETGFGAGVPTWATDRYGNAGKAIAFDDGAKITVPYTSAVNPAQITIALWVKAAEIRESNRFLGLQSWNGYKFQLQSANKAYFTGCIDQAGSGVFLQEDTEPELDLNKWYHIAATWGSGQLIFYINGVLTRTVDGESGDLVTVTGHDLVFGVGSSKYAATADNYDVDKIIPLDWGGYFHGTLDEIRMYNTVLTATQITSIYDVEKP
ncbi:MAG: LamG domain-containing protein [Bacteroidales bacterium]|nr:LamG domain-containing protein [Bacteroidales bacterium]